MRAVHLRDRATAYALVNAHHAALDSQRGRIAAALEATDEILRRSKEASQSRGRSAVHIKDAARTVGVRPSAVRFWERQGLLHPSREPSTDYRLYDAEQLARLNVIALLRDVGYRFDAIRQVLDELAGGRPDQIRHALDERLETLNQTTWACITATSTLHDYLESHAPLGQSRKQETVP